MGLKSRIVDRGKQLVQSPTVMRWVSDDRVMKAAEGVLDARTRVKLAWHMLKNGHALPAVDPALDDSLGETVSGSAGYSRGYLAPSAGNGSSHAPEQRLTEQWCMPAARAARTELTRTPRRA